MNIVFNLKKTLDRLGDDKALFNLLAQTFLNEIPNYSKNLQHAINQKQFDQLAYESHRLTSSCMIIGLECATELSQKIEKMIQKNSHTSEIEAETRKLINHLDQNCKSFLIDNLNDQLTNAHKHA